MSQFAAEKFTTRDEAIEAAQLSATTAGNTTTEPITCRSRCCASPRAPPGP